MPKLVYAENFMMFCFEKLLRNVWKLNENVYTAAEIPYKSRVKQNFKNTVTRALNVQIS